ncbi:MAG: sulfotransferase [Gammaproteobacteria bacterium]|nr:sulfotransferase [Gammaproteobacteria bacterium]
MSVTPYKPFNDTLKQVRQYLEQGQGRKAADTARTVLESDDHEAIFAIARLFSAASMSSESAAALERCTELNPGNPVYRLVLARIYERMSLLEKGIREYRAVLVLDADNAAAMHGLAASLVSHGNTEEAEDLLLRAVGLEPRLATAHYLLATIRRYQGRDDPHVRQLRSLVASRAGFSAKDYSRLCFALGRALDQLGDFDQAFFWIQAANEARKTTSRFDLAGERSLVADRIRFYPADLREKMQHSGYQASWPVLIVGMPRSGSTLVEQILASHPAVFGAGEIMDLQHCLSRAADQHLKNGESLPAAASMMPAHGWLMAGESYAHSLRQRDEGASRIVDKQLFNYLELGAAGLMLKNIRIIHCVRDPLDTLWSCYFNAFKNDRGFTHDFNDLGNTWLLYRQLMGHWREQITDIHEVAYEDLVADVAGEARKLVEFLRLEWDDACLSFHDNPRQVTTASQVQVHQEIYQSSVGRWRNYERQLQPLREIIETNNALF